jgi:hypothetical protein
MSRFPIKKVTPETGLKQACLKYLRYRYGSRFWSVNVPGGVMTRPGTPDTLACLKNDQGMGIFVALEFKNGSKGKVSPVQQDTLFRIHEAGGIALVIRTVEDCIEYFRRIDGFHR